MQEGNRSAWAQGDAELGHRLRAPGAYKLLPKYVLSLHLQFFSKAFNKVPNFAEHSK